MVFFSTGMALGILLISIKTDTSGAVQPVVRECTGGILSGFMVSGRSNDCGFLFIFVFKELLTISFDEELARANGLPSTGLYLGLLVSLSLTVVVSVVVVGVVLSAALLVIPAATGCRLSRNYRSVILISAGAGIGSGLLGLIISYYYNLPSGASIVACAAIIFFCSFFVKK